MELLDIALNIKESRKRKGLTVEALAAAAGVTKGYISQVENFRTVPSLPQLCRIAEALGIDPARLLQGKKGGPRYVITRKNRGVRVEREHPESGFVYRALAKEKGLKLMEPFILEMPPGSTRRNVVTQGDEFFYMVAGAMDFFLGREKITLRPGDSLYFDGRTPHHPENNTKKKAVLLVVYAIGESGGELKP